MASHQNGVTHSGFLKTLQISAQVPGETVVFTYGAIGSDGYNDRDNHIESNGYRSLYMWMGIVTFQRKIVVLEGIYILYVRVQNHMWQRTRRTR